MVWFIALVCFVGTYYFLRRSVEADRMQQDVMQSYVRAADKCDNDLLNGDSRRSNE